MPLKVYFFIALIWGGVEKMNTGKLLDLKEP